MSDEVEEKPELEVKPLPVAIQRLIDEVKLAEESPRCTVAYNRVYNRHNRS